MPTRFKVSAVSGNINTLIAGTVTAGNPLFMGNVARKIDMLSAVVNVTAATSTLTWTGKWQYSDDKTNWVDLRQSNNAANVVLATGTSAATGDIGIDAPYGVNGAKWVRFVLLNGVATGGVTDLFAISYSYRQMAGGDLA